MQLIQLVSDTFARANENPLSDGGNWSQPLAGQLQIVSQIVECNGTGALSAALWTTLSWPNDQYTQTTIGTLTFNSELGLIIRSDSALQNYYVGLCTLAEFTLFKIVSGSPTQLAQTTGLTFNSGDTLILAMLGQNWTFFQNGTLVASGTDSTYASGVGGFYLDANSSISNAQVTSWAGGKVTSSSPSQPGPSELHLTYAPNTTAGAVTGAVSGKPVGSSTIVGQAVPSNVLNNPDDALGTNTPVVPHQGQPLTITTDATGKTLTIKGTLSVLPGTSFTISNPA